ncbi:citrate/2-methylcitrate synthase [Cellulosilyticum lentocellum]|uniref:Citrate synthase n=1 Tax=Cellulosilyticum lentocellum (strain ATCC 49066 / DSM 5427 / NCIMB 11756 / RHM5) TaxID=642492 RepID=F2JMH1_CELLD|nr:Citrate synthase [Cellulosilyticum lentocellum DSM 5427]
MRMQENKELREQLIALTEMCEMSSIIDPELFSKYSVKRGLRDLDGRGVLVGLTEIGEVHSYIVDDNEMIPVPGQLRYRGINVEQITKGYLKDKRFGFEETTYLLLFGHLPNEEELKSFESLLGSYRDLPDNFFNDMILKAPTKDIMNSLARSVLALYSYDDEADNTSTYNVLRQCLSLISRFPTLAVYGYQAYAHSHLGQSLYVHSPKPELSTAENILHMLRPDCKYTHLEATLLDLALILHAEHGGGNNSSFTTHLVTSSGTDTYSVMAAALGSLKGPKHGGANIKVVHMFEDMKAQIKDWTDDAAIEDYLGKLLNKQAFDKAGLIYGIGHAVYSISDPRAIILKEYAEKLAHEKGLDDEYHFYTKIEALAPQVIARERKMYKGVSANVDFYSGFVYNMLGLPLELYTPIFAIARISGWSAHRIEELVNRGKIIRPAYKSVAKHTEYIPLHERSDIEEAAK